MRNEADVGPAREVLLGELEHEGRLLPVSLTVASRISLHVSFLSGERPADRTVFPRLIVRLAGGDAELSSCRLHVEYTRTGGNGRLVFLDEVYDCKSLITERRLVNLGAFFHKLPLVLAQKDRIQPEFREFTANALYDLSIYKKFFNEQDRILANEPPEVAEAAQAALLRTEGRRFFQFFDAQLERLQALVKGYDKEAHERHGFYLRRLAWDYIIGSEFLKRTNLKPRGYAGDAEMMVMAYRNEYVGRYVFNKLMHKHPLETPAAQAVRNRRSLVTRELSNVRQRFAEAEAFRFLSVAAGPAWELQDVFVRDEDFAVLRGVLLDQDPHALATARRGIEDIERARGKKVAIEYLSDSVRTMLRTRNLPDTLGRFHFIYSMGLFDYLTPPVARAVLAKMYELLLPGGALVVGNYHVANPTRYYMAYWMDWVLYYRSEEDFLELAQGLPGAAPTLSFDETRCQMFLRVDKQG